MRETFRRTVTPAALVLAGLALVVVTASAQHGGGSGGHGGGAGDGHRKAQECEAGFERVVADGRGFGMAFAADQNGYPGPTHVLELAERLGLTADQEAKARELLHAMLAESRPKGARLLEAEARLRRLFAERVAGEPALRAAVLEVERARAEVRLVHLLTHVKTRGLLTEQQIRLYHEARWGAR